jgi:hypothetical protein
LALLASACGGGGASSTPAAAGSTSESTTGSKNATAPESGESRAGGDAKGGPSAPTGKGGGSSNGGGSHSSGGGSSHSSANASLIRQGEAICAQAKEEQVRGVAEFSQKQGSNPPGKAAIEELTLKVGLPPIKTALAKLNALQAPAEAAAEFDAIVGGLEKALAEAEADPAVIVTASHTPFDEPDRLAREFGLKACAGMS